MLTHAPFPCFLIGNGWPSSRSIILALNNSGNWEHVENVWESRTLKKYPLLIQFQAIINDIARALSNNTMGKMIYFLDQLGSHLNEGPERELRCWFHLSIQFLIQEISWSGRLIKKVDLKNCHGDRASLFASCAFSESGDDNRHSDCDACYIRSGDRRNFGRNYSADNYFP